LQPVDSLWILQQILEYNLKKVTKSNEYIAELHGEKSWEHISRLFKFLMRI